MSPEPAPRDRRTYSLTEERVHAASHAVGAVGSIIGLGVLLKAATTAGFATRAACVIYGASLVLMYSASTAYHGVPAERTRTKRLFRMLDHSAIFILIAGTYTVFALTVARGPAGYALLTAMWGLCIYGILGVCRRSHTRRGPIALSLTMGWLAALVAPQLVRSLAPSGVLLLFAGGILYTLGVPFYVWRKLPHHHGIWHAFVLLGSFSHFLAVAWFVLPRAQ